ncbi:MAG: MATE family efflux transporter [Oscillospiraceae bacterium]|nr:MATE family efflux transporter [Oscillospiraceae bacterium]
MSAYNESLIKGSVVKGLVRFAIPVLLSNILQIVYSTTDLFIVGRFASTADVSGVSTGSMLMGLVTFAVFGLVHGVAVLVGRNAGAKSEAGIRRAVGTSVTFFAIFCAAAMIPLILFNKPLVSLMNTPPEAVDKARSYFLICAVGTPFIVGYNLSGSIMRGFGNSKTPLFFVGVSCGINIILDYILIRWVHMGASGAAVATVTAQGISLLFSGRHVLTKTFGFRIRSSDIRIDGGSLKQLLKVGVPQGAQELLVQISFMIILAIINDMGLSESAAGGIAGKLLVFLTMPQMAVASSVGTMAAHNLGAGQRERAERGLWVGMAIAAGIGVALHLISRFFGPQLARFFIDDPAVIRNTASYLRSYTIDCITAGFVFPMNSYLASCGYALFTMLHSLAATFGVRVPMALGMSRLPGATLEHIGWSAPASTFVSLILCSAFLYFYVRKKYPARDPAEQEVP